MSSRKDTSHIHSREYVMGNWFKSISRLLKSGLTQQSPIIAPLQTIFSTDPVTICHSGQIHDIRRYINTPCPLNHFRPLPLHWLDTILTFGPFYLFARRTGRHKGRPQEREWRNLVAENQKGIQSDTDNEDFNTKTSKI